MEQKISMMSNTEQQKIKPTIEDVAPELFDGDGLQAVLGFAEYMRNNKTPLRWGGVANAWKAMHKGKPICYVRFAQPQYESMRDHKYEKWSVVPYLNHIREYEDTIPGEEYQELLLKDMQPCGGCKMQCAPETKVITILGKEIWGICHGYYSSRLAFRVNDPDDVAIDRIKELLELEMKQRS